MIQRGAHAIAELVVGLGAPKAVELQKVRLDEKRPLLSAGTNCGVAISDLTKELQRLRVEWKGDVP